MPAPLPTAAFSQCRPWEAAANDPKGWEPATHVRDLERSQGPGLSLTHPPPFQTLGEQTSEWEISLTTRRLLVSKLIDYIFNPLNSLLVSIQRG